jgi:hypothetical protein
VELQGLVSTSGALRPSKFEPRDFAALSEQLNRAQESFEQGHYQASIAIGQVRLTDAARLLERLAVRNAIFNENARSAGLRLSNLANRIALLDDSVKPVIAYTIDGTDYQLPFNLDYWTRGRFSQLRQEYGRLSQALEAAISDSHSDENALLDIERQVAALSTQLDLLETTGREELLRSQSVGGMAIRIHSALIDQGWQLTNSGYVQEDNRQPYTLRYTDTAGNEVALLIASAGSEGQSGEIAIEAFTPDGANSVYTDDVKNSFQDSLLAAGMLPERVERHSDCASNSNAETFIRRAAEEATQANLSRLEQSVGQIGRITA